jgi:hypothetical protein
VENVLGCVFDLWWYLWEVGREIQFLRVHRLLHKKTRGVSTGARSI